MDEAPRPTSGIDFIGSSDALDEQSFEDTAVGGLSALTYSPHRDLYYSLADREQGTPARFYTLSVTTDGARLGDPRIFDVTILRDAEGRPFVMGNDFDGEGIAVTSWGDFFVSSETEPSIRRFSSDGRLLAELPVPQRFLVAPRGEGQANGTFESLSVSPDGLSLFTANQEPLASDDQDSEGRKRIRVLRYKSQESSGLKPSEELFYLTEPGHSVADVAALSERELLVLERDDRIFRVSLEGADVSDEESLSAPGLKPLDKKLLVDLGDCVQEGAGGSDTQVSTPLTNFEGLSLGPRLPDGRQTLLLQSDDGFSVDKVTRIVALGVGLQGSSADNEARTC